jgi:hypothetical protein
VGRHRPALGFMDCPTLAPFLFWDREIVDILIQLYDLVLKPLGLFLEQVFFEQFLRFKMCDDAPACD